MLKQRIDQDLKAAMLSGDKALTSILRGLKSAILYMEVANNKRETGLNDDEVTALLVKEVKKRQESADLYSQGGSNERRDAELAEKKVIERYLPKQLSETEINQAIDSVVGEGQTIAKQEMGKVIASVKQQAGAAADGATVARLVSLRITEGNK